MRKIPNLDSGFFNPAQSLTSCATSEKSLNTFMASFSHLEDKKFGLSKPLML
jgi:hypothetical protein